MGRYRWRSSVRTEVLPDTLSGHTRRQFLEKELVEFLDNILLVIRRNHWSMHDGSQPHFSLVARQFLDDRFLDR